jgi:uncharacterized repeat protein (TIGR02543 family)
VFQCVTHLNYKSMNISRTIHFLFFILLISIAGCKKSAETEGIQALCPIVISTDPMHHAVDIDYDKVIHIDFNTAMDSNSINSNSLLIQDAASTSILTGRIATTEDPSAYIFTPDRPLLPYKQYTLTVKKSAMSQYRLAMEADYSSNFTTIPSLALFPSSIESGIVVGSGNYANGSNVAIGAFHSTGYVFINWTDNETKQIVSTSPNLLYHLDGNHSLTANFIPVVVGKFSVNLSSNPTFGGITIGSGAYDAGSAVLIQATANNNFSFANWTKDGTLISLNPNFQIPSVTSNSVYIANFNANVLSQISLTVSSNPISGGTATGGGTYNKGSSATIKATAFAGYRFVNWTDQFTGTIVSTSTSFTFVLNVNKNVVANFIALPVSTYTLTTIGINGIITLSPNQTTYNSGASVQLTATPNLGYTFTSWSGDTTGTSNPLNLKMVSNKTITANFTAIPPATYTLNITSNNGAVTKTLDQPSYTSGSIVQLTATPSVGYTFTSWSGDTTATSNPLNITITSNKNITANFTAMPIVTYTLTTTTTNGTVTKSPNQTNYTTGSTVQLTATPADGYTFTSWSGDATGSTNPLSIVMSANKNITANFTLIPIITYTLTTTATNGTVTKSPNQVNYASGTSVLLTATAAADYRFGTWTGDASGSTNPLIVNMTSNKNIAANFIAIIPAVELGTIANFGAYGGSAGITNQGVETVVHNGAIGTTAAATLITGFHDGVTSTPYTETPLNIGNVEDGIFTAPPAPGTTASFATATNALSDANTAYLNMSPASKPGGTDPGAGELGGLILGPGIYKSSIATYKITNEDLVLDAQGDPYAYWIFQMTAGLTVGGPSGVRNVILRGGAQAKNVFWYVGSAAVINYAGGGTMVGTIIATSGVTLSSPASSTKRSPLTVLNGRAISLVASVTMVNTVINNQ